MTYETCCKIHLEHVKNVTQSKICVSTTNLNRTLPYDPLFSSSCHSFLPHHCLEFYTCQLVLLKIILLKLYPIKKSME